MCRWMRKKPEFIELVERRAQTGNSVNVLGREYTAAMMETALDMVKLALVLVRNPTGP